MRLLPQEAQVGAQDARADDEEVVGRGWRGGCADGGRAGLVWRRGRHAGRGQGRPDRCGGGESEPVRRFRCVRGSVVRRAWAGGGTEGEGANGSQFAPLQLPAAHAPPDASFKALPLSHRPGTAARAPVTQPAARARRERAPVAATRMIKSGEQENSGMREGMKICRSIFLHAGGGKRKSAADVSLCALCLSAGGEERGKRKKRVRGVGRKKMERERVGCPGCARRGLGNS